MEKNKKIESQNLSTYLEENCDKIDYEKIIERETLVEDAKVESKSFHQFLVRITTQPTLIYKFDYKSLNEKLLIDYSTEIIKVFLPLACKSLKDAETLKAMTQVCMKIQAICPKFKKIYEKVLNAEVAECPREVQNELKKSKMYGLGRITGRLYNDSFFDQKLVLKIINELKISIVCWAVIFTEVQNKLQKEDIDSYLKLFDFIYVAKVKGFNEMNMRHATMAEVSTNILLEKFNRTLSDSKFILEYNDFVMPSFKYAICVTLAKQPQLNYFSDAEPIASAKYFFMIASKFFDKNRTKFLIKFQSMKKNVEMISEVVRLTVKSMEEIFLERKYDDDSDKARNLTAFTCELFENKFMKLDDFIRCLEVMLDAIGFQPNLTTANCIQDVFFNILNKIVTEVDSECWHRFVIVVECFGGMEEKTFQILAIPDIPLQFSEIKSKKVEIAAKMIFESVLKIKYIKEENYKTYLKFCNHIQKYKSNFADSILRQIKEKSVMLIFSPMIKNFNWEAIEKFVNFLAHIEKDFRLNGAKFSLIEPILKAIENRFEDEKNIENWTKLLTTFYEIAKNHSDLMLMENVWFVDLFFKSELKTIKEFEDVYKKIIKLSSETLNGKYHIENDLLLQFSPSFKSYLKSLELMYEFKGEVLIDNVQNHAKFFVQSASIPDFTENSVFLKQMIFWKKMKPSEYKFQPHNEAAFLQGILDAVKEAFEEYFFLSKNKKHETFIHGTCKLIADLYINNVITSTELEFYIDKIIEIVRKKPTALNIHCYHNIVVVPSSEMKKRKDKKLFHKSLVSQKEFGCFLNTIQHSLSDTGLDRHLDDETRIEINLRDEGNPSNAVNTVEDVQEKSFEGIKNLPTRDFKFFEPKSRKKNKKRKKNKNVPQGNETQDIESDTNEKLLSKESQPKVREKSEIKANENSIQDASFKFPSQIEIEIPTLESEFEDEVSHFDVDSFKLLITELEFCTEKQMIEKIKMIKIEGKSCLKVMAREYLEEMSQTDEKAIEGVVKIIDQIFDGFKNILVREITKILSEKLRNKFWSADEFQRLTKEHLFEKSTGSKSKKPQQVENNQKTSENTNQSKKKNGIIKKSKIQSKQSQPVKPNSKLILKNFMVEARKTQNLINFAVELFNIGWISLENFQKLLEFLIAEENFEMVSKILKATSTRILETLNAEVSLKKFNHGYLNFEELLEKIHKNAENNSNKIKIMKEIQNFEFLVEGILKEFVSHAILNDAKEFAKAAKYLNFQNQKQLMNILTKKFKNMIENENSTKLFEILGVFDLFASLLVVEIARVFHFNKMFKIMLNKDSKFLKVFFVIFHTQFEKFYPENLKKYFEDIESKLKISKSKNLNEILKLREINFLTLDNFGKLSKIENFFSKLTSENQEEISFNIQKLIQDDFTEFVNILWKHILKNPQNSQNYLKLCTNFKHSENFRFKLEDFLTYRRRTILRIENKIFPVQARTNLKNLIKFIKSLNKAEIVSENHLNLWIGPHILVRI